MTENNVPKNIPDNMDVVVVIDKEKLPEDIRKLLEENLPKDVQEKVIEMLQKGNMGNINLLQRDKVDKNISEDNDIPKDNRLFAIQTGEVIGNIYKDGIYKKEEDSHIKNKDIKNGKVLSKDLGGCC